jgi:hypothetical protein
VARGEVQHVGTGQADLDDVGAADGGPIGEGGGQGGPTFTHVVRGDDSGGAGDVDERSPDGPRGILVELLSDDAPDVVSLHDGAEVDHASQPIGATFRGGTSQLGGGTTRR